MRDLLDQRGFWISRSKRRGGLGQTGSSPVALNDALTVFRGQGPIVVPVLSNDTDPDGGPLTLMSASAALGTATANGDGTVTYAAPQGTPAGVVTFDTVAYEIADADDNRDTAQIDITITEPVLSVDVTPENTLTVTAAPETVDITVTTPALFAGTYQADIADLLDGPVNLLPPVLEGTIAVGETLTAAEGLWLHDLAAEPVIQSWQWQRAGTDIPGATGPAYVMQPADDGPGLTVVERLTDTYGSRAAPSAAVAVAFTPAGNSSAICWWDADDTSTMLIANGTVAAWDSKIGDVSLTQNTGAWEPATGTRTLNGRNVLDFDGTDHLFGPISLPASGTVAFHMVLAIDATVNAFEAMLAFDAVNDFQIDANNASAFDGRLNAAGIGTPISFSGGPFSGALILSVLFNASTDTAEVFIDGVSRGVMAYTTALDSVGGLHLMTNRSRNASVDGAVGEFVVTADISNRAAYHTYLSDKWGFT